MMDQSEVRLSERGLRVLRLLLENPRQARSGAEVGRATKTGSGTLYPMLARWEAAGWLSSEWELVEPSKVGRPRRRLYRLTGLGQRKAQSVLLGLQLRSGDAVWAT
jgi:PadR family transcriptional regulator, regulatory protein PadR